jgi:hypothetical protein
MWHKSYRSHQTPTENATIVNHVGNTDERVKADGSGKFVHGTLVRCELTISIGTCLPSGRPLLVIRGTRPRAPR